MKYQEFLKVREEKKMARKEKIKNGEFLKSILKGLCWVVKAGWTLLKVTIKGIGKGFVVSLWVASEGVKWIAWTSEIIFNKLDDKYVNKSTYKQRKVIACVMSAIMFFGGTVSLLTINGRAKDANVSEKEIAQIETQINTNKSINESDKKLIQNVEVEVKENESNEDNTSNKVRTVSLDTNIEKPSFIGEMEMMSENGTVDPGFMGKAEVRYKDDAGNVVVETVDVYGSGHFTTSSKKRYVGKFMEYVLNNETDFYNEYFEGVGQPGTTTFDTAWYNAAKYKADEFKQIQYDYVFAKYVEPTVIAVKDKYGIDLLSTKAYQEFAYSTANQYDVGGTLTLFEKAGITSTMTEKEVIEKIQQEKIDSLGVYTYTDTWSYNDSWRNGIKVRCEKELSQLLEMIN